MKLLKILTLFIILSLALFSNVYASETDLSNSLESLSSLLSTNSTAEVTENISATTTSNPVQITENSSTDEGLSISDIINIILIAVGLVLIFLGVAILLRSK